MKVILFGGTGMVGQGVLRECILDAGVDEVLSVGRSPLLTSDPKIRELIQPDLFNLSSVESQVSGYYACFFTLGVTAAGLSEADYSRLTYDLTLSIATTLARLNPAMTFIYVSGAGTDSTERGRMMWARVKGRTENALLRLPFKAAYMFRPGLIQPLHGITSRTRWYRIAYAIMAPITPLLRALPKYATTTEQVGRAMLAVARNGFPRPVLESADINAVDLTSNASSEAS